MSKFFIMFISLILSFIFPTSEVMMFFIGIWLYNGNIFALFIGFVITLLTLIIFTKLYNKIIQYTLKQINENYN